MSIQKYIKFDKHYAYTTTCGDLFSRCPSVADIFVRTLFSQRNNGIPTPVINVGKTITGPQGRGLKIITKKYKEVSCRVINTNSIASTAANNLHANQSNLQKSLARLSSGSKIVIPADDAGGLAVANKLKAVMNRIRAQQNVQNGLSFLQVQDGALKTSSQILDRMSKTMSLDVTKNSDDIANYQAEFGQLQLQMQNIRDEKFNGINLFQTSQSDLSVYTTEVGTGSATNTVAVAQVDTISGIVGDATAQVDDLAVTGGGAGDSFDITITAGGTATTINVAFNADKTQRPHQTFRQLLITQVLESLWMLQLLTVHSP